MKKLLPLLFAIGCGGGGHHPVHSGGGGGSGSNADGGGSGSSAPDDPALAARKAFVDPGGMWMPRQMTLPVHAANLKAMGVALDAAALADPEAEPLAAVVSLGGCTGSFVSPDGLVITNHHCVQFALQTNSTPEHNYVEDGFLAASRGDELAAGPTQHVMVTQSEKDVTDDITRGLADIADPGKRTQAIEDRSKALVAACEKGRAGIKCEVEGFFRGAEYQLIERLELRDVRIVYVPARSIGNYGGEVDNWMWPRHTGDWSFMRAYVGKDGAPADPSPDNVPYHPAHWLKVSTHPLAEHDFVLVAGYPGSTQRITTLSELQFDIDWTYPQAIEQLQEAYDALAELQKQGGVTAIKAGVFKQFVQNALANFQGKLKGLTKPETIAAKKVLDEKVKAWVAQPGHEAYAAAIASLEQSFAEARKTANADAMLQRMAGNGSALLSVANLLVRMAEERPKKDADRKAGFQDRDLPDLIAGMKQFDSQYDETIDRVFFKIALVRAVKMPEADRPWLAILMGTKPGQAIDEAMIDKRIDALYKRPTLLDEETRIKLLKSGTTAQLKKSKDPIIQVAIALRPTLRAFEDKYEARAGDRVLWAPKYAVAMREALGGALAPDANGTLRVTYGTVKRFDGGDRAFTAVSQIPAKDKGEAPFDAPTRLLDAIKGKAWGPYADATLGEVPVDFLSDVDTTGGNSGSPTLNAHGELVGLLFDGNLESVSSDLVFNPAITRSIHLDIRYALWVMDAVDHADNVLTELGVKPAL